MPVWSPGTLDPDLAEAGAVFCWTLLYPDARMVPGQEEEL